MIHSRRNQMKPNKKRLSVLAIGNSFSEDSIEYLYQIAHNAGYDDIVLGNLYIGGCSVAEHIRQIEEGLSDYIYYKNTTGVWQASEHSSILDGLQEEEWDLISLQQVSYQAGLVEVYAEPLNQLITFVNQHKTNPDAKLIWHMTWAYQQNSDHGGFVHYDNNQIKMYRDIVTCVKKAIVPSKVFELIIPTATAIQNLRTSYLGDTLTRDGFHLSFDKGRFCAGLMWFKALTDTSVDDITYLPVGVTKQDFEVMKQAVNAAYINPFDITYIKDERNL